MGQNEKLKEDFLEPYYDREPDTNNKTYKAWKYALEEFERVVKKDFADCSIEDAKKYFKYLKAGFAKNTRENRWNTIKKFFKDTNLGLKFAGEFSYLETEERQKFIENSMADAMEYIHDKYYRPKREKQNKEKPELNLEQMKTLARTIQDPRDLAVILTCMKCALRPVELTGINISDIDWQIRSIKIRNHIDENGKFHGRRTAAKQRDERIIFFDDELELVLERWLALRPKDLKTDALFTTRKRGRIQYLKLNRMLNEYCKLANIPEITPHGLRHAMHNYLRKSMPLHLLKTYIGSARDDRLDSIYSTFNLEDVRKAYLANAPVLLK